MLGPPSQPGEPPHHSSLDITVQEAFPKHLLSTTAVLFFKKHLPYVRFPQKPPDEPYLFG
jgi:hypothetical protein